MAKMLRISAFILFGAFLLRLFWIYWSFHYAVEATAVAFDSAEWQKVSNVYAHNRDPGCVRGGMALDLLKSKQLNGKSPTEIEHFLGKPDRSYKSTYEYELGQCSGLGWHNSILRITVDDNGPALNADILSDKP
ncbi:hypothetical protein JHS3_01010 [Jeongeupia sp. HS-3]|nr:hypothetical protein JHS3_01010 [Jeongeupia sp. HS-3]